MIGFDCELAATLENRAGLSARPECQCALQRDVAFRVLIPERHYFLPPLLFASSFSAASGSHNPFL